MLIPNYETRSTGQGGLTPRRAVAMGSVGLLHVAAVYALIAGMTPGVVKTVAHDLFVDMVASTTPSTPQTAPPLPALAQPSDADTRDLKLPDYRIQDDEHTGISLTGSNSHPASDSAATGVTSTHSTPPYPMEARLLSHQGTVVLLLTISPQGDVTEVSVVRTSGFAELDGEAVAWVLAHWKYKPALQGGVAVTSRTQAAVKFDLKEIRG